MNDELSLERSLADGQIRVLEYDTALPTAGRALACRTRIINLQHKKAGTQPYAALSYTWGDPASTTAITCDNVTRTVTHNLRDALSAIWKVHPSEQIWADALCIDQNNLMERNQQVSMMGDIFWSANHIYIYLGPSLKGRNRFWTLLQNFSLTGRFDSEEYELEFDSFMEGQNNSLNLGINDLIRRPWFRRAWTYQEIRLAAAAIAICGDSFMPWNNLLESLQAFNNTGTFMQSFAPLRAFLKEQAFMFKIPSALLKANSRLSRPVEPTPEIYNASLLELLVDAWPRDASDPRDKVYALTSPRLTSTAYVELRPDYYLDMRRTFIRVIRTHINNAKNLNFLKYAIGTCTSLDWPGRHPTHSEARVLMEEDRWVPIRIVRRDTSQPTSHTRLVYHDSEKGLISQRPGQTTSSDPATLSNIPQGSGQTSSREKLPTWVCDWRMQGTQIQVNPPHFVSNSPLWKARENIPPKAQSIQDFSRRLTLRGCALARVCGPTANEDSNQRNSAIKPEYRRLDAFLSLPQCALQRALDQSSQTDQQLAPRAFQLKDMLTAKNLPPSNIPVLLLQTMLHDQSVCPCATAEAITSELNLQRGVEMLPYMKSEPLHAQCQYNAYPRSPVAELDWVFLLDGLDEAVILRPYVLRTSDTSTKTRSETGFEFVSFCPLTITGGQESWEQAPCAYGDIELF